MVEKAIPDVVQQRTGDSPTADVPFGGTARQPLKASYDSAPTIADVAYYLWRGRSWFVLPALAGFALALLTLIGLGLLQPADVVHRAAISFTAKVPQDGRYPSGLHFSPNDIRSPAVLRRAYEAKGIARYGLSLEQFMSAVTVEPYSPGAQPVLDRYRALLSEEKIDPARRIAIQDDFRAVLREMQSDGALLTLTLSSKLRVPNDVAEATLEAILSAWLDVYINELGATTMQNARFKRAAAEAELAKKMDYPVAYWYLKDALEVIGQRVDAMSAQPGASNIKLDGGGDTLADIRQSLSDVQSRLIDGVLEPLASSGISRSPQMTLLTLASSIGKSEREITALKQQAKALEDVIATLSDKGAAAREPPSGPLVAQYSEGLVDKFVALSLKSADLEYRRQHLDNSIDIAQKAAAAETRRSQLLRQREAIAAGSTITGSELETIDKAFQEAISESTTTLNRLWSQLNLASSMFADNMLGDGKLLYTRIPAPESDLKDWLRKNSYILLLLLGSTLFPALIGLIAYLVRGSGRIARAAGG